MRMRMRMRMRMTLQKTGSNEGRVAGARRRLSRGLSGNGYRESGGEKEEKKQVPPFGGARPANQI
jgi:hypothetical protein